jgi:hypothetical protein
LFDDELQDHILNANLATFLDTMIISMPCPSENPRRSIEELCEAIAPAFVRGMNYDFFFRGIMSMGYFSRSSRMLIEPAADDAASLYEDSNWIGLSLSPSTDEIWRNDIQNQASGIIVQYDVPHKKDPKTRSAMNWTVVESDLDPIRILVDKHDTYAGKFNMHRHQTDHHIWMIYKNTIDFYNYCIG